MTEPVPAPSRLIPLNFEECARLAAELGSELFGYAVRLVSYHGAFGDGIREASIATFLGLTKRRWDTIRDTLVTQFEVRDGKWFLPAAERLMGQQAPSMSWAPVNPGLRARVQEPARPAPIPAATPVGLPLLTAGMEPAPGRMVPLKSPTNHLYETGTELFKAKGQRTEKQARACIVQLIREHRMDTGILFAAVDAAWKQREDLDDPLPWVKARIKKIRQETAPKTGSPVKKRVAATPEGMGISDATAERIRQRNSALQKPVLEKTT